LSCVGVFKCSRFLGVGRRGVGRHGALHRRVEIVEGLLSDDRGDLGVQADETEA